MGLKIFSSIIKPGEPYTDHIQKVLEAISTHRVCGIVCCGTESSVEYHDLLSDLKSAIYSTLGMPIPITLIPQYLLPNGGISLEIYTLDDHAEIEIGEHDGVCYGLIRNDSSSMLFVEGIPSSDFTASVREQSREVFDKFNNILSLHGFQVDDIVRQWNYIGGIVASRKGKQNYQEFNDARSLFYGGGTWCNGYPAATGIGTEGEGIIVGGIAFKRSEIGSKGIYPINNPLQIAAHIYSKQVLIDNAVGAIKSTPKFERAKLIETDSGVYCFVSGTAAIRGEQSVDATSARQQTCLTIENIEHLVAQENLTRHGCAPHDLRIAQLQVFIKNAEDYPEVKAVVDRSYPQLAVVYSMADVCREELLVEIEGILTT